ncbi:MAG: ABC transporter permease [Oscillospiraceae bacterium]
MFKESVKMSWQNIIHNKMRSFLTILGIVIGVSSIIALITMVQGVTESVTKTVSDMGANKITIQARGNALKQGLTQTDILSLEEIDNISGVSPTIEGTSDIVNNNIVMQNIKVQGKNHVYFESTKDLLNTGRAINPLDCENKNRVCVIGDKIVKKYFATTDPIGNVITMNGVDFTIIGTLQPSTIYAMDSNDEVVIIPYQTAMSLLGVKYINGVDIYMKDNAFAQDTTTNIKTVLNQAFNYKDDSFFVFNMQIILDTVEKMTGMMSLMLAAIASISLLVGGIGIMNMMLVSVTERTTEIGLRKALGAQPKQIRQQFLLEAMFLSLFGGIIGLALGVGVAYIASIVMESAFVLKLSTIILAVGFSAGIGVIFGIAPATKASSLNPIDALRRI